MLLTNGLCGAAKLFRGKGAQWEMGGGPWQDLGAMTASQTRLFDVAVRGNTAKTREPRHDTQLENCSEQRSSLMLSTHTSPGGCSFVLFQYRLFI